MKASGSPWTRFATRSSWSSFGIQGLPPGRCGDQMIDPAFCSGRRVFITGHTGFKGGWLSLLLADLGAEVIGFALPPEAALGLFESVRLDGMLTHIVGDVRDPVALRPAIETHQPDVVIHFAAPALVPTPYQDTPPP